MSDPFANARRRWPLTDDVVFLNHGSFGACPTEVLDEQAAWRRRLESEPVAFLEREIDDLLMEARAEVARLLHADPEGLAFVTNATSAVSTVLRALDLGPGEEIVTTDHAYPAVANALRSITSSTGARVISVELPLPLPDDEQIVRMVADALSDRTKVVVIDHVTSPTAAVLPIERIVAACRERAVPVLVDAAHAPGMLEVNVDALGADFWTGNYHKWLCAPKGAAGLWVSPSWRDRVRPLVTSQPWLRSYTAAFDWTGTFDPSAWLSVPAAIRFLERFGLDALRTRNHDLAVRGRAIVANAIGGERVVDDARCGWMSVVPLPAGIADDRDAARALNARMFDEHRIEVPFTLASGRCLVRISAHAYTTLDDMRALAEALPVLLG